MRGAGFSRKSNSQRGKPRLRDHGLPAKHAAGALLRPIAVHRRKRSEPRQSANLAVAMGAHGCLRLHQSEDSPRRKRGQSIRLPWIVSANFTLLLKIEADGCRIRLSECRFDEHCSRGFAIRARNQTLTGRCRLGTLFATLANCDAAPGRSRGVKPGQNTEGIAMFATNRAVGLRPRFHPWLAATAGLVLGLAAAAPAKAQDTIQRVRIRTAPLAPSRSPKTGIDR